MNQLYSQWGNMKMNESENDVQNLIMKCDPLPQNPEHVGNVTF